MRRAATFSGGGGGPFLTPCMVFFFGARAATRLLRRRGFELSELRGAQSSRKAAEAFSSDTQQCPGAAGVRVARRLRSGRRRQLASSKTLGIASSTTKRRRTPSIQQLQTSITLNWTLTHCLDHFCCLEAPVASATSAKHQSLLLANADCPARSNTSLRCRSRTAAQLQEQCARR